MLQILKGQRQQQQRGFGSCSEIYDIRGRFWLISNYVCYFPSTTVALCGLHILKILKVKTSPNTLWFTYYVRSKDLAPAVRFTIFEGDFG